MAPQITSSEKAGHTAGGTVQLSDGRAFASPSRAAMEAADIVAYDDWHGWRAERIGGRTLDTLRHELVRRAAAEPGDGDLIP